MYPQKNRIPAWVLKSALGSLFIMCLFQKPYILTLINSLTFTTIINDKVNSNNICPDQGTSIVLTGFRWLSSNNHYYFHFTGEETAVQRS